MIKIDKNKLDEVWLQHIKLFTDTTSGRTLERLEQELKGVAKTIEVNEKTRLRLRRILFDSHWIYMNHPSWAGLRKIDYLKALEEAPFLASLKQCLDELGVIDPYLARMIGAEFNKESKDGALQEVIKLQSLIRKGRPLQIAMQLYQNKASWTALRTQANERNHLQYVIESINAIIQEYGGWIITERYLQNKIAKLSPQQPIQIFNKQLIELFSLLEKRGLGVLLDKVRKLPGVKNSLNLQKEIKYLGDDFYEDENGNRHMGLLKMVEKGEYEGDWSDFNRFYDSLKAESQEVFRLFGDAYVSKRLIEFQRAHHQDLIGWKGELIKIIELLESQPYQARIMYAAISNIRQEFDEHILRVRKGVEHKIKGELATLRSLVKERKSPISKKSVMQLYKVRKKVLLAEISYARKLFDSREQRVFDLWQELNVLERQISRTDKTVEKVDLLINLVESKAKWTTYLSRSMSAVRRVLSSTLDSEERYGSQVFGMLSRALSSISTLQGIEEKQQVTDIELIRNLHEHLISRDGRIHILLERLITYNDSLEMLIAFLKEIVNGPKRPKSLGVTVDG